MMVQDPEFIYLDYAATSPLAPGVFEAMTPYLSDQFGNPHALYQQGKQARKALESARAVIADAIGAAAPELSFCSGGTEANNTLVSGIAHAVRRRRGMTAHHVICAGFEHHSTLQPVKALKDSGFEVTLLKPERDGFISPDALESAITDSTILVSIMAAQNEIGTIQPLRELVERAHAKEVYFHTDAVQAFGKIPFDVSESGVDAASISAHKLGGPKGTGAFYLRQGTPFESYMRGGAHEAGRRAGTQDVAGVVGFAAAVAVACDPSYRLKEAIRLAALRDWLVARLMALDVRVRLSVPIEPGDITRHLPHLLMITVEGFESESMVLRFDEAHIAVSGGAACSSSLREPNHVLGVLGIPKRRAFCALRISMGEQTTQAQLEKFLATLSGMLNR